MSIAVQVVGARVMSGVGKESKRAYAFTVLQCVTANEKGAIVGELVIDGESIPAPGRYNVEVEPRVRDGRITFGVAKITPAKVEGPTRVAA